MRTDKKNFSTRLATVMMAGTLAAGILGTSAFAAENQPGDPINNVTVKKTVLTDGNTYAPNTTFAFTVENGRAGHYDGNVVYEGVTDGLKEGAGAVFSPTKEGMTEVAASYSATGTLVTDASKFGRAGVYHYIVKEAANNYEGIQTDSAAYDVYVYVYEKADGSRYVGDVVSTKTVDNEIAKADLAFSNNYGEGENDSTHDITIKKVITGNQAKKDDIFTVNIVVNGADDEIYKVVVNEGEAGAVTDKLISGKSKSFKVTDNTTIRIYGLTDSDTVTVTEAENNDGYVASYSKVTNSAGTDYSDRTIDEGINVTQDASKAEVTNTKNATTPTGIVMNYAPYIFMIVLAGTMVVFFFRKKNHKEA